MIYILNVWPKPCPKRHLMETGGSMHGSPVQERVTSSKFIYSTDIPLSSRWCLYLINIACLSPLSLSSLINARRRVEGRSRPARLQSGLPNGDFARSCGLDSREEVKSWGRNHVLCFPHLTSLSILPCYQFTDVSPHLLVIDSILRESWGLS
jgi:hypothetical protein